MKRFIASVYFDVYAETKEKAREMAQRKLSSLSESDLAVVEVEPKSARCDICQGAFAPSEVGEADGKMVCIGCRYDMDEDESVSPDDIPF